MTSALQNRLVGTIIVVALVVIFVPEFLDGEKSTSQQSFVEVPEVSQRVQVKPVQPIDTSAIQKELSRPSNVTDEPAVDLDKQEQNTNQEIDNSKGIDLGESSLSASTQTGDTKSERAAENSTSQKTETPNANKQTIKSVNLDDIKIDDTGWVVQLGSFQHEKNVKSLLKTLNDAGYRIYTRPITNSAGTELTKVFVGPELDKQKLEDALPHLLELTNLKGKITPFEVSAN